jgi:tRNA (cmo5U34)-methyltransferase
VSVEFLNSDLRDVEIENASLVILNLVLQFLPPGDRDACIQGIYQGLLDGGALLISEKILPQMQSDRVVVDQLYMDFKKRSGYSDLEISQKRQALENVMQPESIDVHRQRLEKAGFSAVLTLMQALNFVTLLAIK